MTEGRKKDITGVRNVLVATIEETAAGRGRIKDIEIGFVDGLDGGRAF